jgi:hypothetical protein
MRGIEVISSHCYSLSLNSPSPYISGRREYVVSGGDACIVCPRIFQVRRHVYIAHHPCRRRVYWPIGMGAFANYADAVPPLALAAISFFTFWHRLDMHGDCDVALPIHTNVHGFTSRHQALEYVCTSNFTTVQYFSRATWTENIMVLLAACPSLTIPFTLSGLQLDSYNTNVLIA